MVGMSRRRFSQNRLLTFLLIISVVVSLTLHLSRAVHDPRLHHDTLPAQGNPIATHDAAPSPGAPVDGQEPAGVVPVGDAASWIPSPTARHALTLVDHRHFHLGYDEQAKNPAWVAYALFGPITVHGHEHRPLTFETDFATAAHVANSDYSHSGYDRGHLAPANAIFTRFGEQEMTETFVMSNVIPQVHSFNAGLWEDLESAIAGRDHKGDGWAGSQGFVWVINGPIYDQTPAAKRLRNGTWVPAALFSIIFRHAGTSWDALAFIMPNADGVMGPITRYQVTIGTIDRQAHLDVCAGLPSAQASELAQAGRGDLWP